MKKTLIAAALLGMSMASAPLLAQDAADPVAAALVVGATVYGPQGAEVGKIESMPNGNVVVFTGNNRATLPASAFGKNEKGLVVSMTKAQLDAAVEAAVAKAKQQANQALATALVPDAEVRSSDGVLVGSVQKIEGNNVVVDLADGRAITLQRKHLTADDSGLKLVMTEAQFQDAVNAATAPPAAAASTQSDESADTSPDA